MSTSFQIRSMLLRGRVTRAVRRTAGLVVLLTVHASPLAAESSPAAQPVRHAPWELSFTTSRERNWREFVATAVFTQGDRRVEVDAFWDGGREWKVRFAPRQSEYGAGHCAPRTMRSRTSRHGCSRRRDFCRLAGAKLVRKT
jgi:hypothetical protein